MYVFFEPNSRLAVIGSLSFVDGQIDLFRHKKIFLALPEDLSQIENDVQKLLDLFEQFEVEIFFYRKVRVNFNIVDIEEGIEAYNREKCNALIGIGGQEVLNYTKTLGTILVGGDSIEKFWKLKKRNLDFLSQIKLLERPYFSMV